MGRLLRSIQRRKGWHYREEMENYPYCGAQNHLTKCISKDTKQIQVKHQFKEREGRLQVPWYSLCTLAH